MNFDLFLTLIFYERANKLVFQSLIALMTLLPRGFHKCSNKKQFVFDNNKLQHCFFFNEIKFNNLRQYLNISKS